MATANNQQEEEGSKKITFRFCRECSNMLYPKEDRENNTLEFACRTCTYSAPAETSCVFRNQLSAAAGDEIGNTDGVGEDPTLPRVQRVCPSCRENEAVFFQSQQRTAESGMQLFYVCTSCQKVSQ